MHIFTALNGSIVYVYVFYPRKIQTNAVHYANEGWFGSQSPIDTTKTPYNNIKEFGHLRELQKLLIEVLQWWSMRKILGSIDK